MAPEYLPLLLALACVALLLVVRWVFPHALPMLDGWDSDDEWRQIYVMHLGHTIGVWIPIPAAQKLRTVAQVKSHLVERLGRAGTWPCASQAAFYRIRRAVRSLVPGAPRSIRPEARWEDVLPASKRDASWKALEQPLGESLHPFFPDATLATTACYVGRTAVGRRWTREEVSEFVDEYLKRVLETSAFTDSSDLTELVSRAG